MRVVVFGTKGFLGSALTKLFKIDNFEITEVQNIQELSDVRLENADILINCAGAASVSNSIINPTNDFDKNVLLVHRILEIIRLRELENLKFINLGSAAVYGNPQSLPILEDSLTKPISPYGYHKSMAENLCQMYSEIFGVKTTTLRIFSVYGNGQRKLLLWDLYNKIMNSSGSVVLYGNGTETRDFIHVIDLYSQIKLIIKNSNFLGDAINVGNGKGIEIKTVVEIFKQFCPKKFDYHFSGNSRIGDPTNWCADISLLLDWGYKQNVQIETGIGDYIQWSIEDSIK